MNLLSNFLPGIRDARTPISAAAIWTIACVLWVPLLDLDAWDRSWFRHFNFISNSDLMNSAASTFLLILLAYIVGVVTVSIGKVIGLAAKILIGLTVISVMPFAFILALILIGVMFGDTLFPAVGNILKTAFWLTLVFLIIYRNPRSTLFRISRSVIVHTLDSFDLDLDIEDSSSPSGRSLLRRISRTLRILFAILGTFVRQMDLNFADLSPRRSYTKRLMAHQMLLSLRSSPEGLTRLIGRLPMRFCISTARQLQIGYPSSMPAPQRLLPPHRPSESQWRQWLQLAWRWPDLDDSSKNLARSDLQGRIISVLSQNDASLLDFLCRYISIPSTFRRSVQRQMNTVPFTLRAHHPSVYEEYDRLETEGEFRCAVALPLAFAVFAAVWSTMPPSAPGPFVFSIAVTASTVLSGFLILLGSIRLRASERVIWMCAESQLVKIEIPPWISANTITFKSVMSSGKISPVS